MMQGSDNEAFILAVLGASGSGKSFYIKQTMIRERPKRLLIWDARAEYAGIAKPVYSLREVLDTLRTQKQFQIAYRPKSFDDLAGDFGTLCRFAFAAGDLTFIAEELSDVTKPSWAPPDWRRISTQGRHRRLKVYGSCQRPALMDKSFLGNCTAVRSGRLAYEEDAKTVSKALRVKPETCLELIGHDWIMRETKSGIITASRPELLSPPKPEPLKQSDICVQVSRKTQKPPTTAKKVTVKKR